MNWKRRGIFEVALCALCAAQALAAAQPGVTSKKLNRKFTEKIKYGMSYAEVVKVTGVEGRQVSGAGTVQRYHWDGAEKSSLDITVSRGAVAGATVYSPKHRGFELGKSGFVERD